MIQSKTRIQFGKVYLVTILKYLLFYYVLNIYRGEFNFPKLIELVGIILYWIIPLATIIFLVTILPIYYLQRIKGRKIKLLILAVFLGIEYLTYTYTSSQLNLFNGVINSILSMLFILICWFFPFLYLKKSIA